MDQKETRKTVDIKIYKGLSLKDLDKNFKLFLLLSSFFALGSFCYSFLLIRVDIFGDNNVNICGSEME